MHTRGGGKDCDFWRDFIQVRATFMHWKEPEARRWRRKVILRSVGLILRSPQRNRYIGYKRSVGYISAFSVSLLVYRCVCARACSCCISCTIRRFVSIFLSSFIPSNEIVFKRTGHVVFLSAHISSQQPHPCCLSVELVGTIRCWFFFNGMFLSSPEDRLDAEVAKPWSFHNTSDVP